MNVLPFFLKTFSPERTVQWHSQCCALLYYTHSRTHTKRAEHDTSNNEIRLFLWTRFRLKLRSIRECRVCVCVREKSVRWIEFRKFFGDFSRLTFRVHGKRSDERKKNARPARVIFQRFHKWQMARCLNDERCVWIELIARLLILTAVWQIERKKSQISSI